MMVLRRMFSGSAVLVYISAIASAKTSSILSDETFSRAGFSFPAARRSRFLMKYFSASANMRMSNVTEEGSVLESYPKV